MGTYLINFIVYSMAMVGLLFVCLMVYKKTLVNAKCTKNNNELSIENALNLNARKTLYVVRAGNEKFLIASDTERTTFLSKLNDGEKLATIEVEPLPQVRPAVAPAKAGFKQAIDEEAQAQSFIEHVQPMPENIRPAMPQSALTQETEATSQNTAGRTQGVDYSEVMKILEGNTDKKPVMKEILRKLDERAAAKE